MSLIHKEISDFSVQSYQNNAFQYRHQEGYPRQVERVFLLPRGLHLCVSDRAGGPGQQVRGVSRPSDARSMRCPVTRISSTRHGTTPPTVSRRSNTRCWRTRRTRWQRTLRCISRRTAWRSAGSFIVNPEGRIVAYEVTAGNVGRNADELFRRVQASQFVAEHGDEVCPAKWQPGAETLKAQPGPGRPVVRASRKTAGRA